MSSQAHPLITAFYAADSFEFMTGDIVEEKGEMYVDAVVGADNQAGLIVYADDDTLAQAWSRVGPAVSVARIAGGNIHVAEVVVEYRPLQTVMEVR